MNPLVFFIVLTLLAVAASSAAAGNGTQSLAAWINAKGEVMSSTYPITVTRVSVGHYCIAADGMGVNPGTFSPILVTLQTDGSNSAAKPPGSAMANSGWGDDCNPYSVNSVHIFDSKGNYADRPFSVQIFYPYYSG